MPEIKYPYLPPGRVMRFVSIDDEFMRQAKRAREKCSGDPLFPVGAVLVREHRVVARAGNGFNLGAGGMHICPRIVLDCPSGTGYDLCHLHDAPGHAEPMLIAAAKEQGIDVMGVDVYLYGHWWCCEPCWNVMIEAGVRDVYLLENAHVEFDRDRVYGETLKSSVKSVYLAGAYTNNVDLEQDKSVHVAFGSICEDLGCYVVIPFRDNPENAKPRSERDVKKIFAWTTDQIRICDVLVADVSNPSLGAGGELIFAHTLNKPIVLISKKDSLISNFALGNPSVVYHIKYETLEEACRMLKNVLRQL